MNIRTTQDRVTGRGAIFPPSFPRFSSKSFGMYGERGRNRTCDPRLKRALLYQLSYAPSPDQFLR